ncbi:MAG: HEAT repeat domain-containing protein [bacterium]
MKSSFGRGIAPIGAGLLAVGALALASRSGDAIPGGASGARPAIDAPRAAIPSKAPDDAFRATLYDMQLDSAISLGEGGIDLAARGRFEAHRLRLRGGEVVIAARFLDGAARLVSEAAPADAPLGGDWWAIELDANGAVDALRSHTDAALALGVRATLAAEWITASGHPDSPRWHRAERDTTGRFIARYRRLPGGIVERRRAPYTALGAALAGAGGVEVEVDGAAQATPGVDAWPATIDAETRIAIGGGALFASRATTRVRLTRVGDAPASLDRETLRALVERLPRRMLDAGPPDGGGGDPDRALVDGTTLPEWLGACAAAAPLGGAALARAISGLRAWVTLHPEDIDRVVAAITAAEDPAVAEVFIGALGSSAAPEAELALMGLAADDAAAAAARARAVVELGLRPAPGADVLSLLADVADGADADVTDAALLASGSVAATLAESDPIAAQDAIDGLITRFHDAPDDDTRQRVLRALGNAGTPEALPLVEATLAEADPGHRVAALRALRRVPGADADALLARHLADDADPAVRQSAARALAERHPDGALDPLGAALAAEAEPAVRAAIARAVAAHLPDPRARRLLADAAAREVEPRVREMLAALAAQADPTL